jgi:cytochrome b6-f complex iron-sulfur subunit
MDTFSNDRDDYGKLIITPLPDDIVHEDEDEDARSARQRLSRRRFLRRSILAVGGLTAASITAGALYGLYPNLNQQFGGTLDLGPKADFPAATPDRLKFNQTGVFYQISAKAFVVHLAKETPFLLTGSLLESQLSEEQFVRDADGSSWLALYQRCVHLGTTVLFRNDCLSFKCPSHGAHYHCDGEYLDGPAPRSMDRFPLSFNNDHLFVDTGQIISTTPRIDQNMPRLLAIPLLECSSR